MKIPTSPIWLQFWELSNGQRCGKLIIGRIWVEVTRQNWLQKCFIRKWGTLDTGELDRHTAANIHILLQFQIRIVVSPAIPKRRWTTDVTRFQAEISRQNQVSRTRRIARWTLSFLRFRNSFCVLQKWQNYRLPKWWWKSQNIQFEKFRWCDFSIKRIIA